MEIQGILQCYKYQQIVGLVFLESLAWLLYRLDIFHLESFFQEHQIHRRCDLLEVFSLIVMLAIISLTISTYLITFNQFLYEKLAPILKIFEKQTAIEQIEHEKLNPQNKNSLNSFNNKNK